MSSSYQEQQWLMLSSSLLVPFPNQSNSNTSLLKTRPETTHKLPWDMLCFYFFIYFFFARLVQPNKATPK